jgi:protein-S-isoprenylcysteine O-methyltransferase Ste14
MLEDGAMWRLPALGPRGEGWLGMQGVSFALVAAARWSAAPTATGQLALVLTSLAVVTIAAGACLIVSGMAALRSGNALAATPRPADGSTLVRTGAYRLVRHPIYGGLVLIAVGLAIDRPWAGSLIAAGILFAVLDLKRRREELWLVERFPEYADYRARTKALIPLVY